MLFSHKVIWLTVELKWTQLINTKYSVKTEAWGTFLQLQLNCCRAFPTLLYHLYLEYISFELGIKNFIIISHIIKAGSVQTCRIALADTSKIGCKNSRTGTAQSTLHKTFPSWSPFNYSVCLDSFSISLLLPCLPLKPSVPHMAVVALVALYWAGIVSKHSALQGTASSHPGVDFHLLQQTDTITTVSHHLHSTINNELHRNDPSNLLLVLSPSTGKSKHHIWLLSKTVTNQNQHLKISKNSILLQSLETQRHLPVQ